MFPIQDLLHPGAVPFRSSERSVMALNGNVRAFLKNGHVARMDKFEVKAKLWVKCMKGKWGTERLVGG